MKSIEIIVSRKLIVDFSPHPELYGDYIAELQNGMFTDVFYNETGDYLTITNDEDLVAYLRNQEISTTKYLFRNGVFALKKIEPEDSKLLNLWRNKDVYQISSNIKLEDNGLKRFQGLANLMIVTFKWIEVGILKLDINFNILKINLYIFNKNIVDETHIDVCLNVIEEYFTI